MAGLAAASTGLAVILSGCTEEATGSNGNGKVPEWPWPYTKIDPDVVAARAYASYQESG